jgi:ketosteroid isomerase-like protein
VDSPNITLIKQELEGVNRRDADAMIGPIHPDFEFVPIMAALEGRVYVGAEGVRQWVADMRDHWEFFECFPEEFYDLGDRVMAFGHWRARGRVSGVEVDGQPATWLAWVEDGLLRRWQTYTDRGEALRAAGVTEQDLLDLPAAT